MTGSSCARQLARSAMLIVSDYTKRSSAKRLGFSDKRPSAYDTRPVKSLVVNRASLGQLTGRSYESSLVSNESSIVSLGQLGYAATRLPLHTLQQ